MGISKTIIRNLRPVGSADYASSLGLGPDWLLCDGAVLSRAAYPELFATLGTRYNIGGESAAQFRLPDPIERVLVGPDNYSTTMGAAGRNLSAVASSVGAVGVGGLASVSLVLTNFPPHTHAHNAPSHTHTLTVPSHGHSAAGHARISGTVINPAFGNPGTKRWLVTTAASSISSVYAVADHPPSGTSGYDISAVGSASVTHENEQPFYGLRLYIKAR